MRKSKELKQWIVERDQTLMSFDVDLFRKFYKKYQDKGVYGRSLPESDYIVMAAMCKGVLGITSSTIEAKEKAAEWLLQNGFLL